MKSIAHVVCKGQEPLLRPVEGPKPTIEEVESISVIHDELMIAKNGGYDDPVTIVFKEKSGLLETYVAPYSQSKALKDHPRLGLGQMGAAIIIVSPDGRGLFQLRSEKMHSSPGIWSISAAGGVDPGEEPREAAKRETKEELGLDIPDHDLVAIGTFISFEQHAVRSLYTCVVDPEKVSISLHPEEVSGVKWSNEPEELPKMSTFSIRAYNLALELLSEKGLIELPDKVFQLPFRYKQDNLD